MLRMPAPPWPWNGPTDLLTVVLALLFAAACAAGPLAIHKLIEWQDGGCPYHPKSVATQAAAR